MLASIIVKSSLRTPPPRAPYYITGPDSMHATALHGGHDSSLITCFLLHTLLQRTWAPCNEYAHLQMYTNKTLNTELQGGSTGVGGGAAPPPPPQLEHWGGGGGGGIALPNFSL